jgi:hypothetical protein
MKKLIKKVKDSLSLKSMEKELMGKLELPTAIAGQENADTENECATMNATSLYRKHRGLAPLEKAQVFMQNMPDENPLRAGVREKKTDRIVDASQPEMNKEIVKQEVKTTTTEADFFVCDDIGDGDGDA